MMTEKGMWQFGKKITFDTVTALRLFRWKDPDLGRVIAEADKSGLLLSGTTVSDRENKERGLDVEIGVREIFLLGESPLGTGRLGRKGDSNLFENILRVISSGSFPGLKDDGPPGPPAARTKLTKGQRHQFRDALILASAVSDEQDVFVTCDGDFIDNRESLEQFGIKIMTLDEFKSGLGIAKSPD